MEDFQHYLLFIFLSFPLLFIAFRYLISSRNQSRKLPPSPRGLPIIGHLHLLKQPVHRSLQTISRKLGPVYSLRLGYRLAVVISSPSAAEECLSKNDRVLANRLQLKAPGKFLGYNYKSMLACPYGDELRTLRKLCTVDVLSPKRLNEFSGIRRDETHRLMKKIYTICGSSGQEFTRVQLRTLLFEVTVNSMMRMVAGKRYYGEPGESSEEAIKFDLIIKDFLSFTAFNNPGDFITVLGWLDLWGFEKKAKALGKRMDSFLQGLIDDHRHGDLKGEDTMISHLLSLQSAEPEKYNDEVIKSLVQDLIFGGSETTVSTIEWAMSLLLNHPKQLEKAAAEIHAEIGQDCLVDEQHLPKLHFLQCIIQETLRLYGPGRLLLPHFSSEDCTIGGFDIPRGTIVFINAWAIQTDLQWWDNATEFEPERFETQQKQTESETYNYRYLPFGQGRRKCPGSGMANRVLGLVVASLIQCFEWKRVGDEEIDMSEGTDLAVSRALPLEAMCKPLGIINKALV